MTAAENHFDKSPVADEMLAQETSPTEPSKGSLLVLFLIVFIDLLGFGMVLPLLPNYAREFNVDASGWVLGALMASFSAMQFLFAPLWGLSLIHI